MSKYSRTNFTTDTFSLFCQIKCELLMFLFCFLFYYFVQWPTNAQLIDKLSHSSYMFRRYCVILRKFVVSALPNYTVMSNAVFDKIILLNIYI